MTNPAVPDNMKYSLVSLVANNLVHHSLVHIPSNVCPTFLSSGLPSEVADSNQWTSTIQTELSAASGRSIACSGLVHPSLNPYAFSITDSDQISRPHHPLWWSPQGWSFAENHPADRKCLWTQRYPQVSSHHNVPHLCKIFNNRRDQGCSRPLSWVCFPRETLPQEVVEFFVWAISMLHSQTIPGFISKVFFSGMSSPLYSTEFLLLCENFFWADIGKLLLARGQPSAWEVLILLGMCLTSNLQRLPRAWKAQPPSMHTQHHTHAGASPPQGRVEITVQAYSQSMSLTITSPTLTSLKLNLLPISSRFKPRQAFSLSFSHQVPCFFTLFLSLYLTTLP